MVISTEEEKVFSTIYLTRIRHVLEIKILSMKSFRKDTLSGWRDTPSDLDSVPNNDMLVHRHL